MTEPVLVVVRLARAFESIGVPYLIGGSFASSMYGIPRTTQDVDIVADLRPEHVDRLVSELGLDFYVDPDLVREAIRGNSTFNVLHEATMFKADVFVTPRDPWAQERMKRARLEQVGTTEGTVSIRFSSPEDTLLHKLLWYRLGNEVSERQWSDVVGLLSIQGEALDAEYLERWAPVLGVADLLMRARGRA